MVEPPEPPAYPPYPTIDVKGQLGPAVQTVRFKVTVPPSHEPNLRAELRATGVSPLRRKAYFYDTPELALRARDLFLRARVSEGDEDSTVVLRPPRLGDVPARWRSIQSIRTELDIVGDTYVPSLRLDSEPEHGRIEQVERGALQLSKLFSTAQEAIIEGALPHGISLDDLTILGPIDARQWLLPFDTAPPHEVTVDEWSLPDASRFFELSLKCGPAQADGAQRAFHALLDRLQIGHSGDPDPETSMVLKPLAEQLRSD